MSLLHDALPAQAGAQQLSLSHRRACKRARLSMQAQKIRARLNAGDSEPGEAWPAKPWGMRREIYQRHLRQLMGIEGAIYSSEYIASPPYRRWRWRNLDGSFVTECEDRQIW